MSNRCAAFVHIFFFFGSRDVDFIIDLVKKFHKFTYIFFSIVNESETVVHVECLNDDDDADVSMNHMRANKNSNNSN